MTLRFQPLEIATNSADRDGQLVFSGDQAALTVAANVALGLKLGIRLARSHVVGIALLWSAFVSGSSGWDEVLLGDGDAAQKLLASQHDERHDRHH
jgi:hypothetical protein